MAKGSSAATAISAIENYQKATHIELLGGGVTWNPMAELGTFGDGVLDYLKDTLSAGSPYAAVAAYDPEDDLDNMDTYFDSFNTVVTGLAPTTDFTSFLAQAVSSVDASYVPSSYINSAVSAYESDTSAEFARSVNRFNGPMADINAVMSSAFVMGNALLERGRINDLASYRAKLELQSDQSRSLLINEAVNNMTRMLFHKTEGHRIAAAMRADLSTQRIVAQKEFIAEDADYDYRDSVHELELLTRYGTNAMAAGFGATSHTLGPSKASTQLAAALSTGTQFASLAAPLGPGPAIIAGIAGFLGGGAIAGA